MVLNKLMRCVALFFLPHRDRALQAGGGSGATLQRIELGGDPLGGVRRQGSMGVGPMPASWESSGGGNGSKADLPELPCGATPLQFGDWLYLCGPIMRDLSNVAGRW